MAAQKLKSVFLASSAILALLCIVYGFCAWKFNHRIRSGFLKQERLSFPYYVKPGQESRYTLFLGDLNGLNHDSYTRLLNLAQKPATQDSRSLLIVPSLMPQKSVQGRVHALDKESFYDQISNEKGVVLADNFCTRSWKELTRKKIYAVTSLSPGPFCFSEPQPRDLNFLIRKFHVANVTLVYDVPGYEDFIGNFLEYLKENKLAYSLVQSRNFAPRL